jgi:TPR repeat protein
VRAFAAYTRDCDRGLCANVGYAYAVGVGVVRDERRALEVFRESCATRPGDYACANQGFMQLLGLGGAQSRPKALALLRAAKSSIVNGLIDSCDSGCGRDCSILGAILQARGQKAEAAEKLRRGCTLGDDRACEHRVR